MTLKEQHHKAACDRNLTQKYHGVIVKEFTIVYDDYLKEHKAVVTLQLPFFDISANDLREWISITFPGIEQYVESSDNKSLFNIHANGMSVRMVYLGRDRYTPKCLLYDMRISIVSYSHSIGEWSIAVIQQFLDDAIFFK